MKPRVCIIKTDGTNCDEETLYACAKAGGDPEIVLLHRLKKNKSLLKEYNIVIIPGGFSYGDDIASGKLFAIELLVYLKDQLQEFVEAGNAIIGICNGFQVLVRMGLLPFKQYGAMQATLTNNDSGHFECRWITMLIEKSPCIVTHGLEGQEITLPVAHGEGKFFCDGATIDRLEHHAMIPLRYSSRGKIAEHYPYNPNGSLHAIAGVCDQTGRIFGIMPHPERFTERYHYPQWRSHTIDPQGLLLFNNVINYYR